MAARTSVTGSEAISTSPISQEKSPRPSSDNVTTAQIESKAEGISEPAGVAPAAQGHKLKRDITRRHLILMALGGSIGAGLFVGSGSALSSGGPLSLVLCFAIVGAGVTCTMGALGEMAASFPVAGAFYDYSRRFISDAWGFAMGWNFVFNWLIVFPFELTTIAAQLEYWYPDVSKAAVIAPVLVGLTFTSFLGSRWYGEIEHLFGLGKAVAITVFIFVALAIINGGIPSDPRHGTKAQYWHDPGAMLNGASGFFLVFRTAGMSYGGTELLGMTAAECKNPRASLPLATKIVFFRIAIFYIGALLLLGFVVPANHPDLASTGHGAKYSPFTLAANLAGLPILASFFNVLIIVALISMANASIFAASRAIQALCEKGMGPRIFAEVKWGVPVWAFALTSAFGCLAFINLHPGGGGIFDWLLSLSGASNYYTWASICLSHIRFRNGWATQRHEKSELLWTSPFNRWGSVVGLCICFVGLAANIVTAVAPVKGVHDAQSIVRDNIGTFIPWVFFFSYKIWHRRQKLEKKPHLVPLAEMDIQSGMRLKNDSGEP